MDITIPAAPLDRFNDCESMVDRDNDSFFRDVELKKGSWEQTFVKLITKYGRPRYGSSRMMFQVDEHTVIKFAHSTRGVKQNRTEIRLSKKTEEFFEDFPNTWRAEMLLNHIIPTVPTKEHKEQDLDYGLLVVQDRVDPLSKYIDDLFEDDLPDEELDFWTELVEHDFGDEVQIGFHPEMGIHLAYDF